MRRPHERHKVGSDRCSREDAIGGAHGSATGGQDRRCEDRKVGVRAQAEQAEQLLLRFASGCRAGDGHRERAGDDEWRQNYVVRGVRVAKVREEAEAKAGERGGLRVISEGFVDRRYGDNGDLLPRSQPGAIIQDLSTAIAQATEIALHQRVASVSGNFIPLPAATLCVHGDGFHAAATLQAVRAALEDAGVAIRRP